MNPKKVLFVGGSENLASIRMRCDEVAEGLGCEYTRDLKPEQLEGKELVILVKAPKAYPLLRNFKGKIVVDVLDEPNFPQVDGYIVSSHHVKSIIKSDKPIHVIYQHHCNKKGHNPIRSKKVISWIGSHKWYPEQLPAHESLTDMSDQEKVIKQYEKTDILLNIRRIKGQSDLQHKIHLALNSGIKLINALGYGIPGIYSDEPAYREIAPECCIFSDVENAPKELEKLLQDKNLYEKLRKNCIKRSKEFSLENVLEQYKKVISILCSKKKIKKT